MFIWGMSAEMVGRFSRRRDWHSPPADAKGPALVMARGTNDIEAWQLCVHATDLFMRFNAIDYLEARVLSERALERASSYAYAWATLGFTH